MNKWWDGESAERYWLEVTDRDDVGADLRAPSLDDSGKDNWRYSLFQHARMGDIVFHYKKPAIVGFSQVAGRSEPTEITWAARGSYARSKGTEPHPRPGYRIPLHGFTRLEPPISLADLRAKQGDIEVLLNAEDAKHKGAKYFPFELSGNRDLRLLQGYAFKLPAALVEMFPGLAAAHELANATTSGEPVADIDEAEQGRSPPWARDELILALDLYVRGGASPPGKNSKEVAELSDALNAMGRTLGQSDGDTYRNANGVYMKLMNFRRFDPAFVADGKVGQTRGNRDEEVVWKEFAHDPAKLAAVATAIKAAIAEHGQDQALAGADEPEIEEAEEGRILTRIHRVRERDRKLVVACRQRAMKRHGKLTCAACDFNFGAAYGPVAEGLIEVHHTKPVHTLEPGSKTKLEDLALLCANCHRVVHSSRRWFTVEQVRAMVQRPR